MKVREEFDPACVAFSYGLACLGSLAAVVLMDCRRQILNPRDQRLILVAAAVAFGGCGIWAMHFMGMTALTLTDESGRVYPVSFEPVATVLSLLAAVVFVYLGLEVASRDQYFGKDSEQRVAALQQSLTRKGLRSVRVGGRSFIEHQALYSQLQWLLAGGVLAAAGISIMHYEGMNAMRCNLRQEWHIEMVGVSVVIAVTAACLAFWILFRVLEWKPHLNYLRLAAPLIMGAGASGMHLAGMHAAEYTTWPDSLMHVKHHSHGATITKWAVGAEVVYCVMCIFLVYTHTKNEERSRTREVDKMFLSVAAVSSELVSTSGGSSHSPTPSMVGGQVSSYEKEKVAHFMSLALRYCMAHNSRRRDVDVDAVEQDILRVLRAGGVTTAHQRGSISVVSEAPPINTSIGLTAQPGVAPIIVPNGSLNAEHLASSLPLRAKVHPISPQEEHQQEGNGKHRASQAALAPEVLAQAKTASPPSAPRPSHTPSPPRSSLADSPLARLMFPPVKNPHKRLSRDVSDTPSESLKSTGTGSRGSGQQDSIVSELADVV